MSVVVRSQFGQVQWENVAMVEWEPAMLAGRCVGNCAVYAGRLQVMRVAYVQCTS